MSAQRRLGPFWAAEKVGSRRARALVCVGLAAWVLAPSLAVAAAYTITGVVRNEFGSGVANVDIDLIEYCSKKSVFLVNDRTIANGAYSIVVNEGTYDIRFTPPSGTLAAAELENVVIASNRNLGTTVLPEGVIVAGVVHDEASAGVSAVDLDFIDVVSDEKIFVPNDRTDASGAYSVLVPAGTYDVQYRPPSSTNLLTVLREDLVVSANVTGLIDVLPVGIEVFGKVIHSQNQKAIEGADIDLKNTCTGRKIPLAHDDSDILGNLSVYAPANRYTVHVAPPRCAALGAYRLLDQLVEAPFNLGTISLAPAFAVTGRVLDELGQPLPDADLDFKISDSGARWFTVRDNTDASGAFSVFVEEGTYDIEVQPPKTSSALVGLVPSVVVEAATNVGDIALNGGLPVTGTVLGPGGTGVLNVDVDVRDSLTQASIPLANDETSETGSFGAIVVPGGIYDFRFKPPDCLSLAPAKIENVTVDGPLTLPPVNLEAGVRVSGHVRASDLSPVVGVDLDFFDAVSGAQLFTVRDNTDADGFYNVVVPAGTYNINYDPPPGSNLVAAQRFGVFLPADTALPDTILEQGFFVSGFVYSAETGLPVGDTDLDFIFPGGGELHTPRDNTDANGFYSVVVPGGTWDIEFKPPLASGLALQILYDVLVARNLTLPDVFLLAKLNLNSIDTTSGTTAGGQSVTLSGSGFLPGTTVRFGGVTAGSVTVLSGSSLVAVTPAHPPGRVDVVVTNPGADVATLPAAYLYEEPPSPIVLTVARSGNDVELSWTSTGQPSYTVFVKDSPTGFDDASILIQTGLTNHTDVGGALGSGIKYYSVY